MDYSDSSKFIVSALLNSAHFVAVGFFRDVKNAAVVREKLCEWNSGSSCHRL